MAVEIETLSKTVEVKSNLLSSCISEDNNLDNISIDQHADDYQSYLQTCGTSDTVSDENGAVEISHIIFSSNSFTKSDDIIIKCNNQEVSIAKVLGSQTVKGLTSLLKMLKLAEEIVAKDGHVLIRSDSQYAVNCLCKWGVGWFANGWKNSKGKLVNNLELVRAIYNLYEQIGDQVDVVFER